MSPPYRPGQPGPGRHTRRSGTTPPRVSGARQGPFPADARGERPLPVVLSSGGQGRAWTWVPTVLEKALPLLASQFVDQVMAPRRVGHFAGGTNEPQ